MNDNTGEKQEKAGKNGNIPPVSTRFVKGDKRINRKGRPKNFDQLRALAQQIAADPLETPEGKVSRIEALLRVMSTSRNPADRALFLAYAFGKPREELQLTGDAILTFIIEREKDEKEDNTSSETI